MMHIGTAGVGSVCTGECTDGSSCPECECSSGTAGYATRPRIVYSVGPPPTSNCDMQNAAETGTCTAKCEAKVVALTAPLWPRGQSDCPNLIADQHAARCINAAPRSRLTRYCDPAAPTPSCPYYRSTEKMSYSKCQTYDQAAQVRQQQCAQGAAGRCACDGDDCPPSYAECQPSSLSADQCTTVCVKCKMNVVRWRNTAFSTNQAVPASLCADATARWVQDAAAASNAKAAKQCVPLSLERPCPLLAQPPRAAWRYGCDTECLPTSTGVLSCAAYDQVTLRALGARPRRT